MAQVSGGAGTGTGAASSRNATTFEFNSVLSGNSSSCAGTQQEDGTTSTQRPLVIDLTADDDAPFFGGDVSFTDLSTRRHAFQTEAGTSNLALDEMD